MTNVIGSGLKVSASEVAQAMLRHQTILTIEVMRTRANELRKVADSLDRQAASLEDNSARAFIASQEASK